MASMQRCHLLRVGIAEAELLNSALATGMHLLKESGDGVLTSTDVPKLHDPAASSTRESNTSAFKLYATDEKQRNRLKPRCERVMLILDMWDLPADLRYAFRALRRNTGFTMTAVLTLALGIAASSLIYCVVRSTLLRALPFADADRVVALSEHHPLLGKQEIAAPDFRDWRDLNQTFEGMAAYTGANYFEPIIDACGSQSEKVGTTLASRTLFPLLGVRPALGRSFLEVEDAGGHNNAAMVSDRLWRRCFRGDPSIIGQAIHLNGEAYTIVGVLPREVRMPDWADVWLPLSRMESGAFRSRTWHSLNGVGRLKPGVSFEQAKADIGAIVDRLRRDFPSTNGPTGFEMSPLDRELAGDTRTPLLALSATVALVLLLASANVANLFLTRSVARQREIATRRALGATASTLLRQFLVESWLVSLMGSAGGLALATLGLSTVRQLAATVLPHPEKISFDWHILAFALLLSLFTSLFALLAPATELICSERRVRGNARGGSMSSSQRRWQRVFMISQVALAVAVLVGAGLLVRSFRYLVESNPGFEAKNLLTFRVSLSPVDYATDASTRRYYDELFARLRSLPGVTAAAAVQTPPLSPPTRGGGRFFVDGLPDPAPDHFPVAQIRQVTPEYFRAMGIPLEQGRYLRESDEPTMNVVINRTLARRFFQGVDPVGHNIVLGLLGPRRFNRPIVGVVADSKDTGLQNEIWPTFYFVAQTGDSTVVVRSAASAGSLIAAVRQEALAVDPKQWVSEIVTMDEAIQMSLLHQRFSMQVFSLLSALALALAGVGTYGVIVNQTQRRIPELAVRIALGASRASVYRAVIGPGMAAVLVGILGGLAIALIFTRLLRGMLFGVPMVDSATYALAAGLMAIVALVAMTVPSRHAGRIDPSVALRSSD
jgi:predicted permease